MALRPVEATAANSCQLHWMARIQSDNTLVLWNCHQCHSGPHWMINQCKICKFKLCNACTVKLQNSGRVTMAGPS